MVKIYPGYWRPLGSAPPAPPAFQTPSFPVPVPVQQQVQPPQIGTGCSGNMACASACMKVRNILKLKTGSDR